MDLCGGEGKLDGWHCHKIADRRLHRFCCSWAAEHPLVLFLDDLQWLDAATLDPLEQLAIGQEPHHLLLIGAFRDNEVGPTHALRRMLDAIHKAKVDVLDRARPPDNR